MKQKKVSGVIFDAFGTLCRIESPCSPYRPILRRWKGGVKDGVATIMKRNAPLRLLAEEAGLSSPEIRQMEEGLNEELQSMSLFPEAENVLRELREYGFKLAVISNLAAPYGVKLKEILPVKFDALIFSYEVAMQKPEREIYEQAANSLEKSPEELFMIGDSLTNDYLTPTELGMKALWLNRSGLDPKLPDNSHMASSLKDVICHLGIKP